MTFLIGSAHLSPSSLFSLAGWMKYKLFFFLLRVFHVIMTLC
jgi:hypothetical protein